MDKEQKKELHKEFRRIFDIIIKDFDGYDDSPVREKGTYTNHTYLGDFLNWSYWQQTGFGKKS